MVTDIRKKEVKEYLLTHGLGSMKDVVERIIKFHQTGLSPILLLGESGSGKEFIAKVLLSNGRNYRTKQINAINCAALNDNLIISELFGHTQGAYTGALKSRTGLLDKKTSGVFLDEIDKSSLWLQNLLLRYLRTGEIRKLGSDKTEISNPKKIVFATSAAIYDIYGDLLERIDEIRVEKFLNETDQQTASKELEHIRSKLKSRKRLKVEMSPDFLNRISSFTISVPPLRDRIEDFALLISNFIKDAEKEIRCKIKGITGATIDFIMRYSWPNNLAELNNFIKIGVVYHRNGILTYPGCLKLYSNIFSMHEMHSIAPVSSSEWNDATFQFSWGYLGITPDSLYAQVISEGIPFSLLSPKDDHSPTFKIDKLEQMIRNLIKLNELDYSYTETYIESDIESADNGLYKSYDVQKMVDYFSLKNEKMKKHIIAKEMGFNSVFELNKWLKKNNLYD